MAGEQKNMVLTQRQMLLDGGTGASAATPSLVPPSPKPEPTPSEPRPVVEPLIGMASARKRQDKIVNPEVPVAPDTPKPKTDWGSQSGGGFLPNLRSKILGIDPPKPTAETPRPAPKTPKSLTPKSFSVLQPTTTRSDAASRMRNIPEYLRGQGFTNTAGIASYLEGQGSINPFAPYFGKTRSGKKSAAGLLALSTALQLGSSLTDDEYRSEVASVLSDYGYPEDVINDATSAMIGGQTTAAVAGSMLDSAAMDAQIVGGFGVAGAAAGATFFGVGAPVGFGIGLGFGRIIAGASAMIDYAIEPLLKSITGNAGNTDNWIPTAYDLVPFKSTQATDVLSEVGGQSGLDLYFSTQQAGKFLSPTAAEAEWDKLTSNYYANNRTMKDPRIDEITELISMGHFIGKDNEGKWGIDSNAYWDYRAKTIGIIDTETARNFLPPLSAEGKEWQSLYGNNLNETIWNSLFLNEFVR